MTEQTLPDNRVYDLPGETHKDFNEAERRMTRLENLNESLRVLLNRHADSIETLTKNLEGWVKNLDGGLQTHNHRFAHLEEWSHGVDAAIKALEKPTATGTLAYSTHYKDTLMPAKMQLHALIH